MSFRKNPINVFWMKLTVGGRDNVPPTSCPRTAHVSACVPAHAERTKRPERSAMGEMGVVGQGSQNGAFLQRRPVL
jgi:hypothetical protein